MSAWLLVTRSRFARTNISKNLAFAYSLMINIAKPLTKLDGSQYPKLCILGAELLEMRIWHCIYEEGIGDFFPKTSVMVRVFDRLFQQPDPKINFSLDISDRMTFASFPLGCRHHSSVEELDDMCIENGEDIHFLVYTCNQRPQSTQRRIESSSR